MLPGERVRVRRRSEKLRRRAAGVEGREGGSSRGGGDVFERRALPKGRMTAEMNPFALASGEAGVGSEVERGVRLP